MVRLLYFRKTLKQGPKKPDLLSSGILLFRQGELKLFRFVRFLHVQIVLCL